MKLLDWIKNNAKAFLGIILILFVIGIILNNPVSQNDESTLFGETLKMYNGYKIYKDINVLVTPLFFYAGSVFLKVFGANYLIYRIYGVIIWTFFFSNIYMLLRDLSMKTRRIIITELVIFMFLQTVIKVGANYNILAIAISILGIRIYINNNDRSKKFYFIQGILCFLIFMTKQTIGVYYFVAFVINEIFVEKQKLRKILISVTTIITGLALYIIYLYLDNSLFEFIDYTFLGMIDFRQNFSIESWIILISLVNINLVGVEWIIKKANKNLKKLFIFSVIMLLISYPIICDFHSRMALIYTVICFAYYCDNIKFEKEKLEKIILAILLYYNMCVCILNFSNCIKNHIDDSNDPYYGAIYNQRINQRIDAVVEYIEQSEKKVVIVSPEATLYNAKLHINNGILDLPLKGNTGLNGKEKIINEIKKLSNVKILVTKYIYFQEYPEVQKFVRENYNKTGELLGIFDIYE